MNQIENAIDNLNDAIVKAQGNLISLALSLDKNGIDRSILNKIRNALSDAEYESRNITGLPCDVEIY